MDELKEKVKGEIKKTVEKPNNEIEQILDGLVQQKLKYIKKSREYKKFNEEASIHFKGISEGIALAIEYFKDITYRK
ncbi:hypothetical protein J7E71_12890 [Mesobacillus foraminis]|uniref:hypothetical protein n=1 Tax=Mesobacillus foraminis TaxID=279826 RepID=UPI001BE61B72|nr:hypothetical protein [Mesobacillus foraminis]MBT2756844.1 hypothetical protein [Mesobacillus foraminis]